DSNRAERGNVYGSPNLRAVKPLRVRHEKWHDCQGVNDGDEGDERLEVHALIVNDKWRYSPASGHACVL
ncbi:MAG: hypothetical protein QMB88_04115, partial [Burkholderiaceae bacterium]